MSRFVFSMTLFILGSFSGSAFAKNCGQVVFNCDTHKMTLNGRSSTINCGTNTNPWKGKIGHRGKGAGRVFKAMKGAPLVTLQPPPGNKNIVVHLMPPKAGRTPVGHNRSAGCIHVAPKELDRLAKCTGSPYKVINSSFGKKGKDQKVAKKKRKQKAAAQKARRNLGKDVDGTR